MRASKGINLPQSSVPPRLNNASNNVEQSTK